MKGDIGGVFNSIGNGEVVSVQFIVRCEKWWVSVCVGHREVVSV